MRYNGEQINTESLQKEIHHEALTDQELGSLIKKFQNNHSYTDGNLYACACCGYRQLEQLEPKIEYTCIKITDNEPLLKVLHCNESQTRALHNEQQLCGLHIPSDDNGHFTTIHPWKVWSVYQMTSGIFYHLHPELVDIDQFHNPSICVCPTCMTKLKKKIIPPLSIAAGIDFGHYGWIKNLEMPNLHESIILSLNEVVHITIKITSNCGRHVNFGLNCIKAHVILWPQTSVNNSLEQLNSNITLNNDYLKRHSSVKYYFLDPTGKHFYYMTKMAFSSSVLLPRP